VNSPRSPLAWPLAVSLALHLGLAWLFSPGAFDYRPRQAKAVTLTVSLPGAERRERTPARPPQASSAPPAATAATATAETPDAVTQPPRFLVAPDLAALEDIPVPAAGSLSLRLHVSALGTVDRVIVIRSDPLPTDLLDGLRRRFESTRLTPAVAGSRAVASTLDVVIRYEPAPTPLLREP
jgi:hypothetical protein